MKEITPRPWKYTHRGWSKEDAERSLGYQVYHPTPETEPEMPVTWVAPHVWLEADAKLICAVHDLVDTLEAIKNDCESWLEGEMDSLSQGELLQAFISVATTALTKAKG